MKSRLTVAWVLVLKKKDPWLFGQVHLFLLLVSWNNFRDEGERYWYCMYHSCQGACTYPWPNHQFAGKTVLPVTNNFVAGTLINVVSLSIASSSFLLYLTLLETPSLLEAVCSCYHHLISVLWSEQLHSSVSSETVSWLCLAPSLQQWVCYPSTCVCRLFSAFSGALEGCLCDMPGSLVWNWTVFSSNFWVLVHSWQFSSTWMMLVFVKLSKNKWSQSLRINSFWKKKTCNGKENRLATSVSERKREEGERGRKEREWMTLGLPAFKCIKIAVTER